MDIVTQGLLGSAMALAGARRKEVKIAALIGFASGLLADADAFIRSPSDPLLTIEFHRHFSHSLLFIPIGALIAALILWPFLRRRITPGRLYLYAFLGYATSGLLDACTSYGTLLLWPFSDERIAWNLISIVDPVFSLTLLAAIVYGVRKARPQAAWVGLTLAVLYLGVGVVQHQRAEAVAQALIQQRGHTVLRHVVKPTMANLLLWRSVYESGGRFYVDAVRVGPFSGPRVYAGEQVEKFEVARHLPQLRPGSALAQDITRFTHFSDGFVALDPTRPAVLMDVRYSMLPTSLLPLWGIEMSLDDQDRHSLFVNYRDFSADDRGRFIAMLAGRALP